MVGLLTNPLLLRGILVLLAAGFAFVFVVFVMRRLRRNIADEARLGSVAGPGLDGLPLELYSVVIQRLKEQKDELQVQKLAKQRGAAPPESRADLGGAGDMMLDEKVDRSDSELKPRT